MRITIGDREFTLSTKLGTVKTIEREFKRSIMELFQNMDTALTEELHLMLRLAAAKEDQEEILNAADEHWDFLDLMLAMQEFTVRCMFSGNEIQNRTKLAKFPGTEQEKNEIRKILGLPELVSTGNNSSELQAR